MKTQTIHNSIGYTIICDWMKSRGNAPFLFQEQAWEAIAMVVVFTAWNILQGKPSLGRRIIFEKIINSLVNPVKESNNK